MTWTNGARRGLLVLISAAVISLLVTYSQDVQRFLPLEAIVQGDATDALTEGEVKPSARPGEEATVATAEKNAERNAHAEKNMKEVATFTATYEPTTADPVSRVRAREKSGVEGASSFGYATLAAGERFESLNARRKAHLLDRCHALEQAQRMPFARGNRIINVKPVLQVCVSPKSGSSSWRKLKKQLRARRLVSRRPLTALSVRHPLARLKSAYRDKFLNGNPVSKYDSTWRAKTQSKQSWKYRWKAYWLPALISRGDIQPSPWLRDRQKKMLRVSNPCMQTLFSTHSLANKMGLEYRSQMGTYVQRFMKASFSFEDFLRHILWCRDHGIMDNHWAPQELNQVFISTLGIVPNQSTIILKPPILTALTIIHCGKYLSFTRMTLTFLAMSSDSGMIGFII
ncbi:uncharacterized protein LOC125041462 isoform X1 [Penaeus chinensis]|uniref:uncharacterized protein LOC125041462 isoform X1 n=1 Tax=Penaeus chinensis TaxID=139456 RepID=UPI001FB6185C|nr:uncharacterized protein LOC125041462 isoform X1 [Penaeus chinensis]